MNADTLTIAIQKKQERETAVSQRLLTFILQYIQANNLGALVHNFYLTPTRNEEKRHSIKVSPSTISRELKRNSGRRGGYNWETAQKNAFYHKHRCPGNRSARQDVKEKAKAAQGGAMVS